MKADPIQDFQELTLVELNAKISDGEILSRDLVEHSLARLHAIEKEQNAFLATQPEAAMEQACRIDVENSQKIKPAKEGSFLRGIPVAIKDNICTEDLPTTCASRILEGYRPPYDATVIKKLRHAGAIILGKTNMDEFAMGISNETSAFGPVTNPLDRTRVPGGSSGGSAAAVASGEVCVALGSDTGGSVRLPAAYCGITGLKPTYGRVSRFGLIAYASSLDQIGCLGRTSLDCAHLLEVIAGHDPKDSTSANIPAARYSEFSKTEFKEFCLGLPREYALPGMDPVIERSIHAAVRKMESAGAKVMEINLPHWQLAIATYYMIATAEVSSNLARFDGLRFGQRFGMNPKNQMELVKATRTQGFGPEVKRRLLLGAYVLSKGYYDSYYLQAQKVRRMLYDDFQKAFQSVDVIVTPVSPMLPFLLGEKNIDPTQKLLVDIFTASVNLAGLPALSLPCGKAGHLPVAFQFIGKAFDEGTILNLGHLWEALSKE
jgi:aspartyl-tRNA(Asn)/glutamyl-tRNA(Gln) amidotransferase subunit A